MQKRMFTMNKSSLIIIFALISQWAVECFRDDNKLIIIPHGTNDLQSIEWAITTGANAIEGDIQFNSDTGDPTMFFHGEPCDCTCYDLTLKNTEGTVCSLDVCSKSSPLEEWLSFLVGFPTLALVYLDSKTKRLSNSIDAQRLAASKVIKLVETNLFDKGFKGKVVVGSIGETAYLEAAAVHANESVYGSQIFLSYDEGLLDPTTKLQFFKILSHPNIVYTTGTTACFELFHFMHNNCKEAVELREKGVFGEVIIWTLDTVDKIESYYNIGARGFMTNNVAGVVEWAKLKGIHLAQPGDS